jgi:hypothetical protein
MVNEDTKKNITIERLFKRLKKKFFFYFEYIKTAF